MSTTDHPEEGPTEKDEEVPSPPQDSQPTLTLTFENLTVYVPGGDKGCCLNKDNFLAHYAQENLGMSLEERPAFYAIDDISGYVESGEMVLVLGSNDVSKSTFIKSLCGRLHASDEVSGTLCLNGVPLSQKSAQAWRQLTPYVSPSDNSHSSVLTVKETLTFAAACNCSDANKVKEDVADLLEILGLSHVADTVVGDEELRGISGGQKRRVTVGEMMLDHNARLYCLENITDGLASTDSLSLIQNLAIACKQYHLACVVSLLQPSNEIMKLFDKLVVLGTDGRLDYFGPVEEDILYTVFGSADQNYGSLCDLVLRGESTFDDSKYKTQLLETLAGYRSQPKTSLNTILPAKKYSTSGYHQFWILCRRRALLIARNAVTYTRIIIAVVFGIIIGSLFSALKQDIAGSLGRTGYMFLNCFLVLMLSSAVVLPQGFRQRPTLYKHRVAEFYSGRIAYLSQVVMDIPLSIMEAILLSIISYFWVDMRSGAGYFFYFWGTLVGLEFVGQALGRLLVALIRKQVSANAWSTVLIIGFGTVAGFMPSYRGIPPVLRWLSWLTPVSYAFEGLMLNEFSGRELMIFAVSADDGDSGTGVMTGDAWLQAFSLPRVDWGSTDSIQALNLIMLFIFAVILDLLGMYYSERTRSWYHDPTRRLQSRVKSLELKAPENTMLSSKRSTTEDKTPPSSQTTDWPNALVVRNLFYHVPLGSKKKKFSFQSILAPCLVRLSGKKVPRYEEGEDELTLLNGVEARFARDRMCALMGSSGAGKTTLLDVIAGYKTGGRIEGEIMIDGQPKMSNVWKRISGYAEQNDILNPYLSTLETLRFTASCRLSKDVDHGQVIDRVVHLMGLEEWLDVVVGREMEGEGLPKHARKRLTIAIQLVVQPRILFLDEPTTGLGNNAAALVIQSIRRATDALGLITLATIHQPSKLIWDSFDDLLLLAKGGRVSYMGEMGPKSETVVSHFRKLAKEDPPPSCNPADYVLAALTSVEAKQAVEAFEGTEQQKIVRDTIDADVKRGADAAEPNRQIASKTNSPLMEVALLTKRHLITQWRNPSYSFVRLLSSIFVSFYMGVLFFGDKTQLDGAVFSIGAIFFLVFVLVIPMAASVVPLIEDRAVLYRETVSGTYTRLSYGMGSLIADIPFHILNTTLMFVFFYFLVDFSLDGGIAGYFILMLFLANWVISSMGQLYALASPNEESAHGLAGLSVILSVILMGFLITVRAMPEGWQWAYWANLFHYILQGLVTNELAGKVYEINLDLSGILPGNSTSPASHLVLFEPGVDGISGDNSTTEAALFLAIVAAAGNGTNPFSSIGDIRSLIACFVANECMTNLPVSTLRCIQGIRAPCRDEFQAAVSGLPLEEITKCFVPEFGDNATVGSPDVIDGTPSDFSIEGFDTLNDGRQLELVLCLIRAFIPPDVEGFLQKIINIIKEIWGFLPIIIGIVQNGIRVPGELILFFFGWADFEDGEFSAPFKWHYCMTAVAVFLVSIELFKLIAIRFIVWTKR